VPITFGRAVVDPYHGFVQYTVVSGDALAAVAQQQYGDFPGQVLHIPQ
jgi:hypothetical protein